MVAATALAFCWLNRCTSAIGGSYTLGVSSMSAERTLNARFK
jgi:hypothetical protein